MEENKDLMVEEESQETEIVNIEPEEDDEGGSLLGKLLIYGGIAGGTALLIKGIPWAKNKIKSIKDKKKSKTIDTEAVDVEPKTEKE